MGGDHGLYLQWRHTSDSVSAGFAGGRREGVEVFIPRSLPGSALCDNVCVRGVIVVAVKCSMIGWMMKKGWFEFEY